MRSGTAIVLLILLALIGVAGIVFAVQLLSL